MSPLGPEDPALDLFLRHFALRVPPEPRARVHAVAAAFARLPYENLTKILADAGADTRAAARRTPLEVVRDHAAWGTGGTCFALTATLRALLHGLGFVAEPLLADRPYGPDTHCALAVWIDGEPHLVDPGYLLADPVPLTLATEHQVQRTFNRIDLVPRPDTGQLELHTVQRGHRSLRLAFRTSPVDWEQFVAAWDASFDWEMMRYPVVTQVIGDRHVYLQGNRVQTRDLERVDRVEIAPDALAERITATFGIAPAIVHRALAVLDPVERLHGRA